MVFPSFSTPKIARVAAERQALPVLRRGAGQLCPELGEIVEEALDAWRGIGGRVGEIMTNSYMKSLNYICMYVCIYIYINEYTYIYIYIVETFKLM